MQVTIPGRGTYILALNAGNLEVSLNGSIIFKTLGNPTKPGNPSFTDLTEANAYFQTTSLARPVVEEEG